MTDTNDPADPANLTDDEQAGLLAATNNGPVDGDPDDQDNVPQSPGIQQ